MTPDTTAPDDVPANSSMRHAWNEKLRACREAGRRVVNHRTVPLIAALADDARRLAAQSNS